MIDIMARAASRARTHRRALVVAAAAVVPAAAACVGLRHGFATFAAWGRTAGAAGVIAFGGAQIACTLLLVPAWPLRVAAGFVWGFRGGFALAFPTSLAASVLAFAIGRSALRERVARRVAREPRLSALDGAVAGRGFSTVLLLRLSPVFPNEAVNYALGLTGVRPRDYALASAAGMVPTVAGAVAVGSLATSAADLVRGHGAAGTPLEAALGALGVLATGALALAGVRLARRALGAGSSATVRPPE